MSANGGASDGTWGADLFQVRTSLIMTVRSLVTVIIGVIAFVIIDKLIGAVITGTDTGSVLIQTLLRMIVAAAILIGVVMSLGGGKRK